MSPGLFPSAQIANPLWRMVRTFVLQEGPNGHLLLLLLCGGWLAKLAITVFFLAGASPRSPARLEFLTHIYEPRQGCRGVVRSTVRALEIPADGLQQDFCDL
jgi:hypothetical protein